MPSSEISLKKRSRSAMKNIVRWLPAIIWMAAIFYLSHQTGEELGSLLPLFQIILPAISDFNWGHFIAYFILALTVYYALGRRWPTYWGKLLVILICAAYGVTDEIHQHFVPGRMPDFLDLRNDVIGAAIAMMMISIPRFRRSFHKHILRIHNK
jgi:VanZ family protein